MDINIEWRVDRPGNGTDQWCVFARKQIGPHKFEVKRVVASPNPDVQMCAHYEQRVEAELKNALLEKGIAVW